MAGHNIQQRNIQLSQLWMSDDAESLILPLPRTFIIGPLSWPSRSLMLFCFSEMSSRFAAHLHDNVRWLMPRLPFIINFKQFSVYVRTRTRALCKPSAVPEYEKIWPSLVCSTLRTRREFFKKFCSKWDADKGYSLPQSNDSGKKQINTKWKIRIRISATRRFA